MSDTPKISNRGNAASKTSVTDDPKISNRGNYAAKTSVFDSPKISERGNTTIPAKEYNDNITNRSISVFDNNIKYDKPVISERSLKSPDASRYDSRKISKRANRTPNRDSVQEYFSNAAAKPNPSHEYGSNAQAKINPTKEYKSNAMSKSNPTGSHNSLSPARSKTPFYESDEKNMISRRGAAQSKKNKMWKDGYSYNKLTKEYSGNGLADNREKGYNPLPDKYSYDDGKYHRQYLSEDPSEHGLISDRRIAKVKSPFYESDEKNMISRRGAAQSKKNKMWKDGYSYDSETGKWSYDDKMYGRESGYTPSITKSKDGKEIRKALAEDVEEHGLISDRRVSDITKLAKNQDLKDKNGNTYLSTTKYANTKVDESDLHKDRTVNDKGIAYMGQLLRSNGIFSRSDIDANIYTKFSRFGVINPYNGLNRTREFLFFTRPNLHIMATVEEAAEDKGTNLSVSSEALYSELGSNLFFQDLVMRHKNLIPQLQSSYNPDKYKTPFMCLLSNTVSNTLDLPTINGAEIETAANMYGTSIPYRGSSYKSDEDAEFTLEFTDTKYGEVYTLVKAYDEYIRLKADGLISPPDVSASGLTMSYKDDKGKSLSASQNFTRFHKYKELHDRFSIFKIIVDEDMETILYWAKAIGCYFNSVPRDAFSDLREGGPLKFTVDIKAPFIRDKDPIDILGFDSLISRWYGGKPSIDNNIPIYIDKSDDDGLYGGMMNGEWCPIPYITTEQKSSNWLAPSAMQFVYKLKWYEYDKI